MENCPEGLVHAVLAAFWAAETAMGAAPSLPMCSQFFASERNGPDGLLGSVVADLSLAVFGVAAQQLPVGKGVVACLGRGAGGQR